MSKTYSEKEVRRLRALCYGECTDKNWEDVKKNWMTPDSIRFLEEHSKVPPFFPIKDK
jgi:hypothetical protein